MTLVALPPPTAALTSQLSTLIDLKGVRVCAGLAEPDADTGPAGGVTIAVPSGWTPGELGEFSRRAVAGGRTVLPLRQDGAVTLLGPLVGPGMLGCLDCAEDARMRILSLPIDAERVTFGGPFPPTNLPAVAAVAASIIHDPAAAAGRMWIFNSANGRVSANSPAPRPGCPTCDRRPDDTPDAARVALTARPLPAAGAWRQDNPATAGGKLAGGLLDGQLGAVVRVNINDERPLPTASALFATDGRLDHGYGRGLTAQEARRIALFEAVERQLGRRPAARRTVLHAAYADLGTQRAVDPARLGLPDLSGLRR